MNKSSEPITDDAELAKVLEGMQDPTPTPPPAPPEPPTQQPSTGATAASAVGLNFDDDSTEPAPYLKPSSGDQPPAGASSQPLLQPQTTSPSTPTVSVGHPSSEYMSPPSPIAQPSQPDISQLAQPTPQASPAPTLTAATPSLTATGNLDAIKKDALENLRPLVDKLNLPADEKFDTLLLLIRSTDDQSLVTPAYDAARNISDESKRAEALLNIIKEIDYFSHPGEQQPPQ